MKQFLITFAGVFCGLIVFFVGLPALLAVVVIAAARPPPAPDRAILTLDLREPLTDQETTSPFSFLMRQNLSVVGTVRTLTHAAADARVRALYIRLPEGGISPAAADEISAAIEGFRRSGKPVIAFSQGIYPSGVSTTAYLLGAASGDFWMQPGSSLQSVGLAVEETFFKRAFDRYGVKADFEQRAEFKNAVNPLLYDDYTPAHKEAELGWLHAVYDAEIDAAALQRRISPATLKAGLEAGPYSAEEAQKAGLIDHVGEERQAANTLMTRVGPGAKLIDATSYGGPDAPWRPPGLEAGPVIAFIPAEGEIVTGKPKGGPLGQSSAIYSDQLTKAFYDAVEQPDVKAIVFRVSSPGGSDTASEQILNAVKAARAAGKPVVVSMGEYAASGGYWISSQASEIVAEPTTLTGSIGVFGGKFVIGPALAKFGVDTRGLAVGGDFASAYGAALPFSTTQKAKLSAWMDRIYEMFIARVAEGRGLPQDRVRAVAKGRIWSGAEALHLGLVDKLGGLDVALAEAERLAHLPEGTKIRLLRMPSSEGPFSLLARTAGAAADAGSAAETVRALLSSSLAERALRAAAETQRTPEEGAVLVPTALPR